jgi:hypothetical protein
MLAAVAYSQASQQRPSHGRDGAGCNNNTNKKGRLYIGCYILYNMNTSIDLFFFPNGGRREQSRKGAGSNERAVRRKLLLLLASAIRRGLLLLLRTNERQPVENGGFDDGRRKSCWNDVQSETLIRSEWQVSKPYI